MADLTGGTSAWASGSADTATTLVDGVDQKKAQHINGPNQGVLGIQSILGAAASLKGTLADLVTRLAVALNSDGTIKASTPGAFTGLLPVSVGGTNASSFTASQVLRRNSSTQTLESSGYTVPGASGVLASQADTQTLTNKTISGANNTITNIGTGSLKIAQGSVSYQDNVSSGGQFSVNQYTFASPYITSPLNDVVSFSIYWPGRLWTIALANTGGSIQTTTWDYLTASDNPHIYLLYNAATGQIGGAWTSDDPPHAVSGLFATQGFAVQQINMSHLETLSLLTPYSSQAESLINDRGLRMQNQAFRALQLIAEHPAPSKWLIENISLLSVGETVKVGAKKT